jgi:23S rRNA (uracil1939-C5)-methyltransferase
MEDRREKTQTLLVPPAVSGTDILGTRANTGDASTIECVHADRCGGCPILSLPYADQLALKRSRVVHSLARYTSLEQAYTEAVVPAENIVRYRTRAKLMVASGNRLGLFAKGGGHQVVDIEHCRVLSPLLSTVAGILRAQIAHDAGTGGPLAPVRSEREHAPAATDAHATATATATANAGDSGGLLRAIDLREIRGQNEGVLVTLVILKSGAETAREALVARAIELCAQYSEILGVAINWHDGDSPQVLGAVTECVAGLRSVVDRVGAVDHIATYGSFVQANRGQAARIHQMLLDAFELGDAHPDPTTSQTFLDLYGGSGAIALALGRAGASVHMVESFAPAVQQALLAAEEQGLRVTAECGDAAAILQRLASKNSVFSGAIVNPPRRGMSPDARRALAELGVPRIAYISCDPETLARDLDHFSRLGYLGASIRPLDMIPLTDEVETVVILQRTTLPAPRILYESEELVAVERCAHDVVDGPEPQSLLSRVRSLPGFENATSLHRTDSGTSGLAVFARDALALACWEEPFRRARSVYLAGVRGIAPAKGAIQRDLREHGHIYHARTRYRRLAISAGHSILRVIPDDARPHQARRHLAAINHPVLGDTRYGHPATNRFFEEKNALDRPFIHVVRLEIDFPAERALGKLILESPLAGDLRGVLERTGGPGTLRFLDQKNALGSGSIAPPPPGSVSVSEFPIDVGSAADLDLAPFSMRPPILTGDDDDSGGSPGA